MRDVKVPCHLPLDGSGKSSRCIVIALGTDIVSKAEPVVQGVLVDGADDPPKASGSSASGSSRNFGQTKARFRLDHQEILAKPNLVSVGLRKKQGAHRARRAEV
jgi:hypothetical protein